MKTTRAKVVAALFAAFLMVAALPSASSADRDVWGMGALHEVDVERESLMVGRHQLKVTHRSRFFDLDGKPLTLAELLEHESEDAHFVADRVGRQLYLTKLELTDEEPH